MTYSNASPAHTPLGWLVLLLVFLIVFAPAALAEEWKTGGHIKYRIVYSEYDDNDAIALAGAQTPLDQFMDFRFKARNKWDSWDANIHFQGIGIYSDTLEASRLLPVNPLLSGLLITDETRLFDLSRVVVNDGKAAAIVRLDRLSVGYTTENFVGRFGRQAISWGNGLLYNPMDIINPFDPTAIDKEYKTGDDMLYTQWLKQSGDDTQGVWVPRRDPATGLVTADKSALALKYHGRINETDYDLFAAQNYGETILGIGGGLDWRGAVIQSDITATWTDSGIVPQFVANFTRSFMWSNHNVSGFIEYSHNGFGQADGDYSTLWSNQALLERIARGETFGVAQNYLGSGLTIELEPRWLLSPTLFWNLDDYSALLQLISTFDWKENFTVLAGFNLAIGSLGTEYGGIETPVPGVYTGVPNSVYLQLAYYF